MALCPICGRVYCDHTPAERGQSYGEMMRPLSDEEEQLWRSTYDGDPRLAEMGKKHAHDSV